jgi:hypothetical protein
MSEPLSEAFSKGHAYVPLLDRFMRLIADDDASDAKVASPRGLNADISAFASRIEVPLQAWQPTS